MSTSNLDFTNICSLIHVYAILMRTRVTHPGYPHLHDNSNNNIGYKITHMGNISYNYV